MNFGSFTVDAVRDGAFVCPVEFEYPSMAAERWEPWRHLLADGDKVVNELGGFLVRGGSTVALVDTGFGPAQVPDWTSGQLLESLRELGVEPEDVTDVIYTHLHFDHIGWASVAGEVTFPNAVYHCEEQDWPYFVVDYDPRPEELTFPSEMLPANKLAPVADRIKMWSGSAELAPGIEAMPMRGHTPGHCVIRLLSDGSELVLAGDISHHQAELIEPDWEGVGDVDPDQARRSREELKAYLADNEIPFFGAHYLGFELARIVRNDTGYAWEPLGVSAAG